MWDWSWTGSPTPTSSQTPQTATAAPPTAATTQASDTPTVKQTNAAAASATANATTTIAQTGAATTDAANSGSQAGDQSVISSQDVSAVAVVVQTGADNASFVSAGDLVSLDQTNAVASIAVAAAGFAAIQAVSQTQSGAGDGAIHRQGGAQEIDNLQSAFASARAVQSHTRNHSEISSKKHSVAKILAVVQINFAQAAALATSFSSITQNLTQVQVGGGKNQTQTADQWAVNVQVADASSEVAQTFAGNLNDVEIPARGLWNPALTQSNVGRRRLPDEEHEQHRAGDHPDGERPDHLDRVAPSRAPRSCSPAPPPPWRRIRASTSPAGTGRSPPNRSRCRLRRSSLC